MFTHFFRKTEQSIGLKVLAGFFLIAAISFALFAFYQWLQVDILFSSSGAALITAIVSSFIALLVYFSENYFFGTRLDPISRVELELEKLVLAFLDGLRAENTSGNINEEASSINAENASSPHQAPGKTSVAKL
jgi:hypothetical protein